MINSIERGTRWCMLNSGDPDVWRRVTAQVRRFLGELQSAGAFASVPPDQAFYVICDERINDEAEPHVVHILVQFAATHAGEYHSFMVSHSVNGATVRPIVVNRLEASLIVGPELDQEITIRLRRDEAVGGRL